MSDPIKHECGIALVRLLQPLEYYQYKYGSWKYGLNKLYLLMEKQHNRGQDGAGVAAVSFDMPPGQEYVYRHRSAEDSAINDVFKKITSEFSGSEYENPDSFRDAIWAKENLSFAAELYLGHVRYGTFGKNKQENVHPVWRKNNWASKNLVLAGNFNLTNVDELFRILIDLGQHPKDYNDTVTILEKIGHFLDQENQALFEKLKSKGYNNREISDQIAKELDIAGILRESSKRWDGGFVVAGMIGHGDAFAYRDPWGIRPAFYYKDEEFVVVASERPAIQTVMNVSADTISEIEPGHALIIKKDGRVTMDCIRQPHEKRSCSFERIYFSRGTDKDIYKERKKLGELLTDDILKVINYDLDNTVFSYIPNTAETAFYGMMSGLDDYLGLLKIKELKENGKDLSEEELNIILKRHPRIEKIAVKDVKLRTFISKDEGRNDLVGHVYDITYDTLKSTDNLVIIDDSIVRGTTLKQSIIKILDRLDPKKIIVVSSSPQIRYPDCYGIDMAKLSDFVAFQAAIALLKEKGKDSIINEVYNKSKEQLETERGDHYVNYVKMIYEPFTYIDISNKIAELLTSPEIKADVKIVYQTVENLHVACPDHLGDWYFTGNYPTPGGNKVVSQSFVNYIEGRNVRAY